MKFEIRNLKLAMHQRFTFYVLRFTCMFLLSAGTCSAIINGYETNYTFTAGAMQSWTNGYAGVTLSNPGEHLRMSFARQSRMPKMEIDFMGVKVDGGFVPTEFEFDFNSEVVKPGGIWVAFHAAGSGTMWMKMISVTNVNEWVLNDINLSFLDGWAAGARTSQANFDADIETVDWIGLYVQRHSSTEPQSYGLDNFHVSGYVDDGIPRPEDTDGDGMPDRWEEDHAFDTYSPADAYDDADHDGMSNYAEYLAGTDPNDPNSTFGIELDVGDNVNDTSNFKLEWESKPGRRYDILRSDDIGAGFQVIETNILSTPPLNVHRDRTVGNGKQYFYKVRVSE